MGLPNTSMRHDWSSLFDELADPNTHGNQWMDYSSRPAQYLSNALAKVILCGLCLDVVEHERPASNCKTLLWPAPKHIA